MFEFLVVVVVVAAILAGINIAASRWAESRHPPIGTLMHIDGEQIHYVIRGQGDPIVFLHGNVTMMQDFLLSGLVETLSQTNQVILFDRPGFGHSTRSSAQPFSAAQQADVISKALDKLDISRAVVCGHSWGTLVALALAERHSNRVGGLVLISGYYFPQWRLDTALMTPVALPIIGDLARYTVSPPLGLLSWPIVLRIMFGPPRTPPRFKKGFAVSLALRPSQIKAIAQDGAVMNREVQSLQETYADLAVPVAVLAGDSDRIIDPEKQSFRIHNVIKQSSLTILPGLGHMLHHEAPDQVVKVCHGLSKASARLELRGQRDKTERGSKLR